VSAWYCSLCGAPARPGSVQPAAADDERFATGVCSGEHQYGPKDRRQLLETKDPNGKPYPSTPQRRVGMVRLDTPPSGPNARAAAPAVGAVPASLWGDP
jgi:hypothetical protein